MLHLIVKVENQYEKEILLYDVLEVLNKLVPLDEQKV